MNQNKSLCRRRLETWLPYIILTIWFCGASAMLGLFSSMISDFTAGYYVPGKEPTDWFPPVLWIKLQFLDNIVPGDYNPLLAKQFLVFLWMFFLYISSLLITRKLIRGGRSPYWFIGSLVTIVNPIWVDTSMASIDLAVAGWMGLFFAAMFVCDGHKCWGSVVLLLMLILLVALHRCNAVLLIPVLAACVIFHALSGRYSRGMRLVTCVGVAVLLIGSYFFVNNVLIGAKRTSGYRVMMQSDIYCMDALEGKSPCGSISERFQCGPFRDFVDEMYDGTLRYHICARYGLEPPRPGLSVNWDDEWVQRVKSAPMSFLVVRTVLTWQFFSSGRVPDFLIDWVQSHYPQADVPKESFPYHRYPLLTSKVSKLLGIPVIAYAPRYVLVSAYLLSLFVFPFLFNWKSLWHPENALMRLAVTAYVASVIYTLSLIVFVPTPDCRYLTPSFVAWAYAIGAFLTQRWTKTSEPVVKKDE